MNEEEIVVKHFSMTEKTKSLSCSLSQALSKFKSGARSIASYKTPDYSFSYALPDSTSSIHDAINYLGTIPNSKNHFTLSRVLSHLDPGPSFDISEEDRFLINSALSMFNLNDNTKRGQCSKDILKSIFSKYSFEGFGDCDLGMVKRVMNETDPFPVLFKFQVSELTDHEHRQRCVNALVCEKSNLLFGSYCDFMNGAVEMAREDVSSRYSGRFGKASRKIHRVGAKIKTTARCTLGQQDLNIMTDGYLPVNNTACGVNFDMYFNTISTICLPSGSSLVSSTSIATDTYPFHVSDWYLGYCDFLKNTISPYEKNIALIVNGFLPRSQGVDVMQFYNAFLRFEMDVNDLSQWIDFVADYRVIAHIRALENFTGAFRSKFQHIISKLDKRKAKA